ncbi:MAG TPA: hypothetical protein DEB17_02200 [Chlorobaculum sp.]|uniref:H+-transporting ATPase-related protein n=1 Tax=Chlorobaculum tepidum (strain ATCC 49652 / DSM 12025 / NBRC 103806 / TLS) TaxID=194439 RepID=Q8KEM2_CHLTE|nr:H+-transporting ATPase-related protein [Chlorobaculum tepidum TLS]HBU22810.1 hypothetical protein [Chlorobaculum sp.]
MNEHEQRLADLCTAPVENTLDSLNTSLDGLSTKEAKKRLAEYGPNELTHQKRLGFRADMFNRLKSPLAVQLLVIALVSAVIGEHLPGEVDHVVKVEAPFAPAGIRH